MNTRLKTLFEVYKIRKKDRHELKQIFGLLPADKQINFLNKFPEHAQVLRKIYEDMDQERQILLGNAFIQVDQAITKVKQKYPA
ncbi:hypothetical protein OAN96_00695 [Candidatus Gracilibacteria bacterium]|nr:hypothetical protein [Candidatus Gracilibacteria bacterium]